MGLCQLHYDRLRSQGPDFDRSPGKLWQSTEGACRVEDCTAPIRCVGLCNRHYARSRVLPCACGGARWRGRSECLECHQNKTAPSGAPKKCTACLQVKPENEFGVRYDKSRRVKVRARCRECDTNARTKVTTTQVILTYGTVCHLCEEEIDMLAPRRVGAPGWEKSLHRDHVVPLALGGTNTIENCRPAHAICNLKKGAKG